VLEDQTSLLVFVLCFEDIHSLLRNAYNPRTLCRLTMEKDGRTSIHSVFSEIRQNERTYIYVYDILTCITIIYKIMYIPCRYRHLSFEHRNPIKEKQHWYDADLST
jgi:hypothetical protein